MPHLISDGEIGDLFIVLLLSWDFFKLHLLITFANALGRERAEQSSTTAWLASCQSLQKTQKIVARFVGCHFFLSKSR